MLKNIHSSTAHNSQKLIMIQLLINRMHKLWHIHTMKNYKAMKNELLYEPTWVSHINKMLTKKDSQEMFKNRQY